MVSSINNHYKFTHNKKKRLQDIYRALIIMRRQHPKRLSEPELGREVYR